MGSNPIFSTKKNGNIAQLVEHSPDKGEVTGSSPVIITIIILNLMNEENKMMTLTYKQKKQKLKGSNLIIRLGS